MSVLCIIIKPLASPLWWMGGPRMASSRIIRALLTCRSAHVKGCYRWAIQYSWDLLIKDGWPLLIPIQEKEGAVRGKKWCEGGGKFVDVFRQRIHLQLSQWLKSPRRFFQYRLEWASIAFTGSFNGQISLLRKFSPKPAFHHTNCATKKVKLRTGCIFADFLGKTI